MSCIVRGCRSHSGHKGNSGEIISFHKFPKIKDIRAQWFTATDRSDEQHKHHWRVCSRHFDPKCFVVGGNLLRARLHENAVPTLNLSSTTKDPLGFTILDKSNEQQRNTRLLARSTMGFSILDKPSKQCTSVLASQRGLTCPSINVSQQQGSRSVSVLPMPLATTSMGLKETTKVSHECMTEKAIYEGRIDKLQKQIQKLERLAKNRLLKLNAQKQKNRRLKQKNLSISQTMIDLLERE